MYLNTILLVHDHSFLILMTLFLEPNWCMTNYSGLWYKALLPNVSGATNKLKSQHPYGGTNFTNLCTTSYKTDWSLLLFTASTYLCIWLLHLWIRNVLSYLFFGNTMITTAVPVITGLLWALYAIIIDGFLWTIIPTIISVPNKLLPILPSDLQIHIFYLDEIRSTQYQITAIPPVHLMTTTTFCLIHSLFIIHSLTMISFRVAWTFWWLVQRTTATSLV